MPRPSHKKAVMEIITGAATPITSRQILDLAEVEYPNITMARISSSVNALHMEGKVGRSHKPGANRLFMYFPIKVEREMSLPNHDIFCPPELAEIVFRRVNDAPLKDLMRVFTPDDLLKIVGWMP